MIIFWNFFFIPEQRVYVRIVYKTSNLLAAIGGTFTAALTLIRIALIPLNYEQDKINTQKSIYAKKDELKVEIKEVKFPTMASLKFLLVDIKEGLSNFSCFKNILDNDRVYEEKNKMLDQL